MPKIIPKKTAIHGGIISFGILLAGKINENKLTEIKIPTANPRLLVLNLGCTFFVKNTVAAPNALLNHINKVQPELSLKALKITLT